MPRTTSVNRPLTLPSTMTTEALRGSAAHIRCTAAISPASVALTAQPSATGLIPSGPPSLMPSPNVVIAAGNTRAAARRGTAAVATGP